MANDFLPDAIMTDLVMPVMDGFELGRKIRQSPQLKHIPIIANSASVFDTYKQQSLKAGCDVFIEKPIQMNILLEYLQKCLPLEWIYEGKNTSSLMENQPTSDSICGACH
jgi:CheY-like chemotaxis protein